MIIMDFLDKKKSFLVPKSNELKSIIMDYLKKVDKLEIKNITT